MNLRSKMASTILKAHQPRLNWLTISAVICHHKCRRVTKSQTRRLWRS
ncbi:Uncharacterised protein [Vibrio cholerae]|nr:Uncharacterised protein [Vibrio cholerae]